MLKLIHHQLSVGLKNTNAYLTVRSPFAKGLVLVLSTFLSISLSQISFTIQPADLNHYEPT